MKYEKIMLLLSITALTLIALLYYWPEPKTKEQQQETITSTWNQAQTKTQTWTSIPEKEPLTERNFCKIWKISTYLSPIRAEEWIMCSHYLLEWNRIKYKQNSWDLYEVEKADTNTFDAIDWYYAKDKDFWYYKWDKIEESDGETFRVLSLNYSKDKNYAFYNWKKLEWSDWKTFEVITANYAKDKNNAYKNDKILKDVDVYTFEVIEDAVEYSKDENSVYFDLVPIKGCESETFSLISYSWALQTSYYSKDRKEIFYKTQKVKWADLETFKHYQWDYAKDKNSIFFRQNKIQWANLETFKILWYGYWADDKFAYSWSNLIEWSNWPSFEVMNEDFQRDQNHVYANWLNIEDSDWLSFEILNKNYAKDKNQVYFNKQVIGWADAATFKVDDGSYFTAEDKNFKYIWAERRDRKSAMRNFIEAYFATSNFVDQGFLGNPENTFQLNNNNWDVTIKIRYLSWNNDEENPYLLITCTPDFARWCLPRWDAVFWQDLEYTLKQTFAATKRLTVYLNDKLLYDNWDYQREDWIVKISNDWRYAELSFISEELWPREDCLFIDMQKWVCLFKSSDKFLEENEKEAVEKKYQEIREKYKIERELDWDKWFLVNSYFLNDEVSVIAKEYRPEEYYEQYWENVSKINKNTDILLVHSDTNTTITVISKPNNFVWLYWHKQMMWLLLLVESHREWEDFLWEFVISQDLMDTRLAQLYNNIGMHYYSKKDYYEALKNFKKAVTINDKYGQWYFNKACVHSLLWQKSDAIQALKKAIEIDSKVFKEKAKNDTDLNRIRKTSEFINLVK